MKIGAAYDTRTGSFVKAVMKCEGIFRPIAGLWDMADLFAGNYVRISKEGMEPRLDICKPDNTLITKNLPKQETMNKLLTALMKANLFDGEDVLVISFVGKTWGYVKAALSELIRDNKTDLLRNLVQPQESWQTITGVKPREEDLYYAPEDVQAIIDTLDPDNEVPVKDLIEMASQSKEVFKMVCKNIISHTNWKVRKALVRVVYEVGQPEDIGEIFNKVIDHDPEPAVQNEALAYIIG